MKWCTGGSTKVLILGELSRLDGSMLEIRNNHYVVLCIMCKTRAKLRLHKDSVCLFAPVEMWEPKFGCRQLQFCSASCARLEGLLNRVAPKPGESGGDVPVVHFSHGVTSSRVARPDLASRSEGSA